ncbi:MAG TPA: YceI family protein [Candidatus Saccharimonadales bacterium]|jgi:polyisoprenoid-binding protein YceI|nr:YceI family protein [Candidatus Saccharimonadales bacterium]
MNPNPKIFKQFNALVTLSVVAALLMLTSAQPARAQALSVQIDPAQSKVEYSLSSTVHTVHGTFAVKNGSVRYDPAGGQISGTIVVDATSGQSGNDSRDGRMHREILESAKFPEIVFSPATLTGAVAADGISKVEVSGRFRLHGQEHEVTVPVEVKANGKNFDLTAHLEIPYVKWGLKNPSNFLLHVSETVTIEIQARGNVQSTGNP